MQKHWTWTKKSEESLSVAADSAHREIKIEGKAQRVPLAVGRLAGIVLVFVVGVELKCASQRKIKARVNCGRAPLGVTAFVKELRAQVGDEVHRAKGEGPFYLESIAITP